MYDENHMKKNTLLAAVDIYLVFFLSLIVMNYQHSIFEKLLLSAGVVQ